MPRITKKFGILLLGVIFTVFYCEFLIYYYVVGQCKWPVLSKSYNDSEILKALILSDIHLMGPRSNFIDKWRRETQMHRAFQAIITLHRPEVVFVLGDQFDEGQGSNDYQFKSYVDRFYTLFAVPNDTLMYVLVGNHDIGFHNAIKFDAAERFTKLMHSPTVQLVTLKNNHFVLINSMAMEGDSCRLCESASFDVKEISVSEIFWCMHKPSLPHCLESKRNYSRPILLQHFPLYRESDGVCNEPDSAPLHERFEPFRNKIDAISKEATHFLVSELRPRVAFGGHTHYGCLLHHKFQIKDYDDNEISCEFAEYSVPSFSWRNINVPKFMLVSIVPDEYAVSKCGLPRETTMAITAVIFIIILVFCTSKLKTRLLIASK